MTSTPLTSTPGYSNGHTGSSDGATGVRIRDVELASGRTLALITVTTGTRRPATFGPDALLALRELLDGVPARAAAGEVQAVAITGDGGVFAAGADLGVLSSQRSSEQVEQFVRLGQTVFRQLAALPVPTFAFINGLALGGGLELALHATYRTAAATVDRLGLPEVSLGLVPGWGGTIRLPELIGVPAALEVVLWNPLKQNRTLTAAQACDMGIVDVVLPAVRYLEDSLQWADAVLGGYTTVRRNHPRADQRDHTADLDEAAQRLTSRYGTVAHAPRAALDLIAALDDGDADAAYHREATAISDLAVGDQFAATLYAASLIRSRGRQPHRAPDPSLATPVTKVGVIGAGLMARQFALLFLRTLQVPVVLTDVDQGRVDAAVTAIRSDIDRLHASGRIDADTVNRLTALLTGSTDLADFAACDLVIEAVFEELSVKRQVLSAVEAVLRPEAILATNTSSLSVEAIGEPLTHPQRLLGFHFFNPVAVMPLIEIVRTVHTDERALASAVAVAKALGKTAVLTADAPGFVVNRLLAVLLGQAAHAVDDGTPLAVVDQAFAPLGLPMTPYQLIDLVGWKVAAHVLDTLTDAFPDRFYRSENLHRMADLTGPVLDRDASGQVTGWSTQAQAHLSVGTTVVPAEQLLHRLQDALAIEVAHMLAQGVVADVQDIDLAMILGAGWPRMNGGLTPYLDRAGASARTQGHTFHQPPIAGSGAAARSSASLSGAR